MRRTFFTMLRELIVCMLVFSTMSCEEEGIAPLGVEAIDLGLSVKWATCNVGAESPIEYGGYYAWGETEEKEIYNLNTYLHYDKNRGSYKKVDKNISGTKYDVAHVKWGGEWRMPTLDEMKELCENCTWKWTTFEGVNGYLITGSNGNFIFLPASGMFDEQGNVLSQVSVGNYWSATIPLAVIAYNLIFGENGYGCETLTNCYYGLSVRPVRD